MTRHIEQVSSNPILQEGKAEERKAGISTGLGKKEQVSGILTSEGAHDLHESSPRMQTKTTPTFTSDPKSPFHPTGPQEKQHKVSKANKESDFNPLSGIQHEVSAPPASPRSARHVRNITEQSDKEVEVKGLATTHRPKEHTTPFVTEDSSSGHGASSKRALAPVEHAPKESRVIPTLSDFQETPKVNAVVKEIGGKSQVNVFDSSVPTPAPAKHTKTFETSPDSSLSSTFSPAPPSSPRAKTKMTESKVEFSPEPSSVVLSAPSSSFRPKGNQTTSDNPFSGAALTEKSKAPAKANAQSKDSPFSSGGDVPQQRPIQKITQSIGGNSSLILG